MYKIGVILNAGSHALPLDVMSNLIGLCGPILCKPVNLFEKEFEVVRVHKRCDSC